MEDPETSESPVGAPELRYFQRSPTQAQANATGRGLEARKALPALRRIRQDSLIANSLFLAYSTAAQAAFGFIFWLLAARLYSPADVGIASTLVAAAGVISVIGLFGFNTMFVAALPTARNRSAVINAGVLVVFGSSISVAAGYAALAPLFSHKLAFLRNDPSYFIAFSVLTAFIGLNTLTDSVFIAFRQSRFNALIDGLLQGASRLVIIATLVGLSAIGIFIAFGLGAVIAAVLSLLLMRHLFAYRPRWQISLRSLTGPLHYAGVNYVANTLIYVPTFVIPLFVLNGRGAKSAGFYYTAFQITGILYGIISALGLSFFAEGSQAGVNIERLSKRVGLIFIASLVPAVTFVAFLAPNILGLFGDSYKQGARSVLVVLAIAALAVGLNTWTSTLLRLRNMLRELVATSVVYMVGVCVPAFLWRTHPLAWMGFAWLIGNLASGVAGVAALCLFTPAIPKDVEMSQAKGVDPG